ncbi:winged helix DNA-binding domain-containing protein [Lentibacter algarum]|uniref:winged helix-turn-helix domain-containing protein n=1 Tax=Lentibacter algarum TaxID=576131 RepID=UPI001C068DAC|nr:crosslink repair DNA glycosylase YcaQ family protein [Lentibacter algarum]MBU2981901.1 winged helix DNA-binding domain-containing protein [Lentibacter algarum]
MSALLVSNAQARRLWLSTHGLANTPTGKADLAQIIHDIGFVQLDSIRHIERAHEHIMWTRNQNYRLGELDKMLKSRALFEHFTHDASLIPMGFLPMWQRQFQRTADRISAAGWWRKMPDAEGRAEIRERIRQEGALSTRDFDSEGPRLKEMWQRPPHKLGLDYMWYAGELATCHRKNFVKYYDLAERVFPEDLRLQSLSEAEQIDALCRTALERLGFATPGEIQRFWDACSAAEVRAWIEQNKAGLIPLQVTGAKGETQQCLGLPDIVARLESAPEPTARLRIINPFDPAFRDRKRTEHLFGFYYRNEIFVPEAKRQYGYYVYPVLEGARLIGRTELKADRKAGKLRVANIWPEAGVAWPASRQSRFESELARMARFTGLIAEP